MRIIFQIILLSLMLSRVKHAFHANHAHTVFTTVCDLKLFIMRKHCVHYLVKQGNNVRLTGRSPVQSTHAENCLILVPCCWCISYYYSYNFIFILGGGGGVLRRGSCHHVKAQSIGNLLQETMTTPAQNSSLQNSVTCLKEPLSHLSSVKSGASNLDTTLKDNYW